MKRNRSVAVLLGMLLLVAGGAFAGPTLICHSFDIGELKSLPWTSHGWNLTGAERYDTAKLAADTLGILDANATVLLHMETLRRATLYARKDPRAAKELLTRLVARANHADSTGAAAALAWFDAGYLAEAYKQWLRETEQNPAAGIDGYSWVRKAIAIQGSDAQMEFAAAIISMDGPAPGHSEHVQRAISGAKNDPMLERNLHTRFNGPQSETMAEMISRVAVAREVKP